MELTEAPAVTRTRAKALPDRIKVVGVKAMGTDLVWIGLAAAFGDPPDFRLVPEPWNPVDPNAVRVEAREPVRGDEWTLVGYVPRQIAAVLDARQYRVTLDEVLYPKGRGGGRDALPCGLRLKLEDKRSGEGGPSRLVCGEVADSGSSPRTLPPEAGR